MTHARNRLIRALAALALALSLLVVTPAPAHAHWSSYCGHGQVGWYETVTWRRSASFHGYHYHEYEHRRWDLWKTHDNVWRRC